MFENYEQSEGNRKWSIELITEGLTEIYLENHSNDKIHLILQLLSKSLSFYMGRSNFIEPHFFMYIIGKF